MPQTPPANVIELLQAMVRIDSVNGKVTGRACAEDELAAMLTRLASTWMMETELLPVQGFGEGRSDQLLITHRVGEDRPWILFDSHMDTVTAEGMTIDPFGGELFDGNVLGRGTCDTKGTGAAMLWALHQYQLGSERPNNIALLFSTDEEIAMTGIQSFVKHDLPRLAWSPDLVVVGEPTEHTPVVAHNGCVRFEITTHGKAAHSSVPSEGRSAIADMVKALALLHERYIDPLDVEHPLTGHAACSVNLISGGSAPNIIPERCVAEVDRRIVPGEPAPDSPGGVLTEVRALLDELAGEDAGFRYDIHVRVHHPPLLPESSAQILPLVKHAMAEHGVRRPTVGAPFATHASYLANAGLPTLVFGPGSPYPAHTKDEWVSVKEIEQGAKVYASIMQMEFSELMA
ncbi:M20/M25/M40 family metallo-hydrolase [Phycisphaeraceae bacterium D3-23]